MKKRRLKNTLLSLLMIPALIPAGGIKAFAEEEYPAYAFTLEEPETAEVGADMMPEAMIALQDVGIAIPKKPHVARQYLPKMQQQYDYIFDLRDYDDPYLGGQAAYDAVCSKLLVDLEAVYHQIFDLRNPHPVL